MQLLNFLQQDVANPFLMRQPSTEGTNLEQIGCEQSDLTFKLTDTPVDSSKKDVDDSNLAGVEECTGQISLNVLPLELQELAQQLDNPVIVNELLQLLANTFTVTEGVNERPTPEELPPDLQKLLLAYQTQGLTALENVPANVQQLWQTGKPGQVVNFVDGLASAGDLLTVPQHIMDSVNEKSPLAAAWSQFLKDHSTKEVAPILSRANLPFGSLNMQTDETAYPDQKTAASLINADPEHVLQRPYNESKLSQMLQEFILSFKTKQPGNTIINVPTDVQSKMSLNNQSNTPTSFLLKHENGSDKQIDPTTFLINNDILSATKSAGGKAINLTRTEVNNVYMQLAEAIRGQVVKGGQGQTQVSLQLQPKHLGEVVIKIIYRDGNIATHFQTASEHAKYMIESSLSQLKETLSSFNLNLQNATVSIGGENNRRGQNWDQNRQHKKQFDGLSGKTMAVNEKAFGQSTEEITGALDKLNYFV
ncbi:flagellar hook-length control protein [Desulfoscipio gibsoniae DSM 7213]|uniref:Flagellar hook-length control protein n=2 Tax=Desulfoscipio gibsoniae TaxID=102134 RepID=R4KGD2_9FIRM|nr:flagellar hook-length control protein [Desulfoscipio gibsoniae DSM 7213]